MADPSYLTPANTAVFAMRWLVAYGLAVVAATLVLSGFEAWQATASPEPLLERGRTGAHLFWHAIYLSPLVAGFGLTFALGFSFFPELSGIGPRRWRYMVLGTLAGIIIVLLGTPDPMTAGLSIPIAGAVGGLTLASLRLGRLSGPQRPPAPTHNI